MATDRFAVVAGGNGAAIQDPDATDIITAFFSPAAVAAIGLTDLYAQLSLRLGGVLSLS